MCDEQRFDFCVKIAIVVTGVADERRPFFRRPVQRRLKDLLDARPSIHG
jgi:hypothetical protein